MTLEEAGAGMERSVSSLSKAENGRTKLPARDVRAILDYFDVDDERTREALLTLARDAHKRGWWQRYEDTLSPSYLDFVSLEADAAAIRTFETILIPGLLQTEDYARAIITSVPSGPHNPTRDVDQLLTVRMARQRVLTENGPPQLSVILDEAALHHQIGGPATMRAQLERLIETSDLDHVNIQVQPYDAGAHAGANGAFTILGFPVLGDLDVVLVETLTSGLYLEAESEIRRYNLVFDHLRMSALSAEDSRKLVLQAARNCSRSDKR